VRRLYKSSAGFTYLAALVLVIVLGIMLGVAAQSWTMLMKREREAELLFRGRQIVEAIARWNNPTAAPGVKPPVRPLNDLKDLLTDPNSLAKVHYLRRDPTKAYNDPITGKEWDTIKVGGRGIVGVASKSEDTPLKQDGFLESNYPLDPTRDSYLITMYKNFKGKTKYKDWQFVYQTAGQQQVSNPVPGARTNP
jgi:type II secretory pathway pseudopilin PulG